MENGQRVEDPSELHEFDAGVAVGGFLVNEFHVFGHPAEVGLVTDLAFLVANDVRVVASEPALAAAKQQLLVGPHDFFYPLLLGFATSFDPVDSVVAGVHQ